MKGSSFVYGQNWFNGLMNIIFPPVCLMCNENWVNAAPICMSCEQQLDLIFEPNNLYKYRFEASFSTVDKVLVFCQYDQIKELIWQFKYVDRPDIAVYLGTLFGQLVAKSTLANTFDCLIPVPLHSKKEKIRGYNQAYKISIGMAKSMGLEVDSDSLVRIKHTQSQTSKSTTARMENVSDAFLWKGEQQTEKRHFLLVDDVLTTGATMASCAQAIYEKYPNCDISCGVIALA